MTINGSSHQRCSVEIGVLRNFEKFTGKYLCQRFFFNKVAGLRPTTLLKKSLWHRCFPVNFPKFLRTPFLQNTTGRLLLNKVASWGDRFRSFSCRSLEDFLFISFQQKNKMKKGNYPDRVRVSISLKSKISKEIWQMVIWSENVFKGNLMLQFSWSEKFRKGKVYGCWTLDELQH